MHESPRIRRLRNDLVALDRLSSESSVFQFKATGSPANHYQITFLGKGLCRDRGKIKLVHLHRIEIKLGASYPRTIPEIRWLTPVYHPNISEIGMVCLGGYGTHWVPSVQLDELCMMLWDMTRYHNYDIRSPYNREAALWVANQTSILFPTDSRPLRDLQLRGRSRPPPWRRRGMESRPEPAAITRQPPSAKVDWTTKKGPGCRGSHGPRPSSPAHGTKTGEPGELSRQDRPRTSGPRLEPEPEPPSPSPPPAHLPRPRTP